MTTNIAKSPVFHGLKLIQKKELTKQSFCLELEIPENLKEKYQFQSGQYLTLQFSFMGKNYQADYSITTAPYEDKICLGIKINSENSPSSELFSLFSIGDIMQVSEPKGRFTIAEKPHEFRTILGFCMGIGITPIISHFKNILHTEPRTRLYLFYGNKTIEDTIFKEELDSLVNEYKDRLEVHYFYTQEKKINPFYHGRLDAKKLTLIINQILQLDDTDEESTIWDAVDEVLICGKGEMIKTLANACYHHGVLKRNIHFELFDTFEQDVYPPEKEFPLIENIEVEFTLYGRNYTTTIPDNKNKILNYLLAQDFPVPYSCKSGICGTCTCQLKDGEVELLENEYLTDSEEQSGKILTCMSIPLSKKIILNFDES
jgi:ring-1,2-phenylacetyl-CoA epoxidase subunit PaaE